MVTRRKLRFLIALLAAAVLYGCGGESSSDNGSKAPSTSGTPGTTEDKVAKAAVLVRQADAHRTQSQYTAAKAKFKEAYELDPTNARARWGMRLRSVSDEQAQRGSAVTQEGYALARQGNFIEAAAKFSEARLIDPNNLNAIRSHAQAVREMRRYSESLSIYDELIAADPTELAYLVGAAFCALEAGQSERCLQYLRSIPPEDDNEQALGTDLGEVWLMRGVAANNRHLTPEAINALKRATRVSPGDWRFHNNLGGVYMEDGQFALAIESFQKVWEYNPGEEAVLFNMGRCYQKLGKYADAIRWYRKIATLDHPKSWLACVHLARCHEANGERDDLLKALSFLDLALSKNPLSHEAMFTLSIVHKKLGNKEDSALFKGRYNRIKGLAEEEEEKFRVLRRKLLETPDDVSLYLQAIETNREYAHNADAIDDVKKLLIIDPDNVEGLHHAIELNLFRGDYRGAMWEARKMLEVAADDARGHALLGVALVHMNQPASAEGPLRKALSIDSSNFDAVRYLLQLLSQDQQKNAAEIQTLMPRFRALNSNNEKKLAARQAKLDARNRRLLEGPAAVPEK